MAGASAFKWYNDLPKWARGTIIVGGAVVVTYTIYEIIHSINKAKQQALSQAEVTGFISDLNSLQAAGVQPSAQQSQYQLWADSIQQQFSGCDYSTPIVSIFGTITYSDSGKVISNIIADPDFQNNADFLALQTAFGIRTISKHFWCGGDDTNVSLSAAINDQLSSDEVKFLNQQLAAKGITYTF